MNANPEPQGGSKPRLALWKRLLPWAITIVCFAFLYSRIDGAAQLVRRSPECFGIDIEFFLVDN